MSLAFYNSREERRRQAEMHRIYKYRMAAVANKGAAEAMGNDTEAAVQQAKIEDYDSRIADLTKGDDNG